jgi:hypothetical protein
MVVRPDGDLKATIEAIAKEDFKVDDLGARIQKAFDESATKGSTYKKDVEPWLGKRAAVAVTRFASGGYKPDIALIVETTDSSKALESVRRTADGKVEDHSYKGVSYIVDTGSHDLPAAGIVEGKLVGATEPAFRGVVDASKTAGLSSRSDYRKLRDAAGADPPAFAYVDVGVALQALVVADPQLKTQADTLRRSFGTQGVNRSAAFALEVKRHAVSFDVFGTEPAKDVSARAERVASLPSGALLAADLGASGKSFAEGMREGMREQGTPPQVTRALAPVADALSTLGPGVLFLRGGSVIDLNGAAIFEAPDAKAIGGAVARVRDFLAQVNVKTAKLGRAGVDAGFEVPIPNTPVSAFMALASGKLVVGAGSGALDAALAPKGKLGDDPAFNAAGATLGEGFAPTLLLDFRRAVSLIGLAAASDPGFQQARPYLEAITTVVAGRRNAGGSGRVRVTVGLR